eukprot:6184029-Prymnesium_polylepis.1
MKVENIFGKTPVDVANENERRDLVKWFNRSPAAEDVAETDIENLVRDAVLGEVAEASLEPGPAIDKEDKKSRVTPLMMSAWMGRESFLLALLGAGADVDKLSRGGASALAMAAECGHTDIARKLVDHMEERAKQAGGAHVKVEAQTMPMLRASENGHDAVVQLLLRAKHLMNCQNDAGMTPLMLASRIGHVLVVEQLLNSARGKDKIEDALTMNDNRGRGVLYFAARHGHRKVLLAVKAAMESADLSPEAIKKILNKPHDEKRQRTALSAAADSGHVRIVESLCTHDEGLIHATDRVCCR